MSNKGIKTAIEDYIAKDYSRFHTPGHKGCFDGVFAEISQWDITELKGLESLFENVGAIKKTEKKLSKVYGVNTAISVGGSTLCIQTMLGIVTQKSKKIIANRNAHVSLINSAALLDLDIVWAVNEVNKKSHLLNPVKPEQIEELLRETSDISAVFITSPDYYGQDADIKGISTVCKQFGIKLLVDGAHGSHYRFVHNMATPIQLGADISCGSLHKTLPALTGAAIIQFSDNYNFYDIKKTMSIFASTSPNYLIMLSIDILCGYLENGVFADIKDTAKKVLQIKQSAKIKDWVVPDNINDPLRVSLGFWKLGYNKKEIENLLEESSLTPELVDEEYIIFIVSAKMTDKDYKRLITFIDLQKKYNKNIKNSIIQQTIPLKSLSIKEAVFSKNKKINIEESKDRISGSMVVKCPPGIPIVVPGEVISAELMEVLKKYGVLMIDVV